MYIYRLDLKKINVKKKKTKNKQEQRDDFCLHNNHDLHANSKKKKKIKMCGKQKTKNSQIEM